MDNSLTIKKPFSKEEEKIIFPMIRLGNNSVMIETIKKLREIMEFVSKHEKSRVQEELTETSKNRSLSGFNELRDLLMEYEAQVDLKERVETLSKIRELTTISQINGKLDDQIGAYQAKIRISQTIKDEYVLKYVISASEDKNF